METKLIAEYRKQRAEHPDMPASQCLKLAMYNIRMARVSFPSYAGEVVTMQLPHGEYIRMTLEPDHDADIDDRLQVEREDVSRYADVLEHASDGWIARDGRVLFDCGGRHSSRYRWQWWTDNYGFAQMWEDGKRGHSRHNAWLRARRMIAESFGVYQEAREDGYVGYVVTLHDADGEEIEHDSVWGFEATGDYAGQEAYAAAESMRDERAEYWTKRIDEARAMMAILRQRYAQAASEYRALRSHTDAGLFPVACSAIRNNLERIAEDFREALRVVIA